MNRRTAGGLLLVSLSAFSSFCAAQSSGGADHRKVLALVNANAPEYQKVSKDIWDYAELGYHETKSSALLEKELTGAGFTVVRPIADEPTAFVASYGSGKPVIGIFAEYDALPGLSQQSVPMKTPVVAGGTGHACGHNLIGASAALAAVSVKQYMEQNHIQGTLRVYGSPAEENGSGKLYMMRAGLFQDVDIMTHWHPYDHNGVINGGFYAAVSAKITFHGVAAQAAAWPERGRSALDAVMLTGNGIEFLREHIPSTARMHYVISQGGLAPNIVPDVAQLNLQARTPHQEDLADIWDRMMKVAQGAALMTGTTMDVKIVNADPDLLPNAPLGALAQKEMEEAGGFRYTAAEQAYATELQKSLAPSAAGHFEQAIEIMPPQGPVAVPAESDVGHISWRVPTIGFFAATLVPGVTTHTWQATASTGMSIGQEGMAVAARSMALLVADLYTHPEQIVAAKADLASQLKTRLYSTPVPEEQRPPLNYREQ